MARDLIGYGRNYPRIKWPEDARVAVSIVLNYEEGAEFCVSEGDPRGERLGEMISPVSQPGVRDLGTESTFEYGSRVGAWRVLRLFDAYNIKATIYACGQAIERNPEIGRAFTEGGHEVAGHGYRWMNHFALSEAEEREQIGKAVRAIEEGSGQRPVGWYTRYAPSPNTRRLLVEEGGFRYDSDSYADELPYWVDVGKKKHLVIPYQLDANDFRFCVGPGWSGAADFGDYLRDSVDFALREGRHEPKMLSIGLHGRIIGRPGRAAVLERFLEYCRRTPGIWFARRVDIADWWHEHYS